MRTLIIVLLAVAAVEAHAKCAAPSAYFLPRPGTALPPDPTVFLIVPPGSYPHYGAATKLRAVSETNAALALTVDAQPTVADFVILKLSVKAPAGTKFAIEGLSKPAAWSVENVSLPSAPLTLTRAKDTYSSWTCSYEALRHFESSIDAPAYRVEFAPTEAELRAGKSSAVVVEGQNDGFLRNEQDPKAVKPPGVRLGHHNCWGSNFVWKTPKVAVRITALMSDGSERASNEVFTLDAVKGWTEK